MASKTVLSVTLILASLAFVSSIPTPDDDVRIPMSRARWPEWVSCNYTETPGASCLDCNTQLICTPIGGLASPCWWPGPHCVEGGCAREPSPQCGAPEPPTTEDVTNTEEPVTGTAQD